MARTDHIIDIRLTHFIQNKKTSSSTSIKNKKSNTGTKRSIDTGMNVVDSYGGAKKAINMIKPFVVASAVVAGTSKIVNATNRAIGTVTNNRYREQRANDIMSAVTNPVNFGKDVLQYAVNRHFEVLRENERIDYRRELSGNSLPYMTKSGGVSF